MSTARLNVWITRIGDPCHIDDKHQWFVHVVDCEGRPVTWCDRSYRDVPAKCGHVEIEIPPGCYTVFASLNPKGKGIPPFGNQLTHVQIVRANCGDHVCVTLFSPSQHYCGTWFAYAVRQNLTGLVEAGVDRQVATAAIEAVERLVAQTPIDTFSANLQEFQGEAGERGR